jgi:hypothetical protein
LETSLRKLINIKKEKVEFEALKEKNKKKTN